MTLPDKTVRFLQKAGMDEENLRQLETLRKEDGKEEEMAAANVMVNSARDIVKAVQGLIG